MAQKLPAWVWLIVGLIIAFTSWYTEMELFFWLGWIFILVGSAKIIIGFIIRKKETPTEKKTAQQYTPQHHYQYYRCSCGNTVRATDQYCTACGRNLR